MKNRKWDSSNSYIPHYNDSSSLHRRIAYVTRRQQYGAAGQTEHSLRRKWAVSDVFTESLSVLFKVPLTPDCSEGRGLAGSRVHPTHKHGPQKVFKKENSSVNLNGEKQNKGRKGGGGEPLSPFLLFLGLYSWCEEEGLEVITFGDVWTERGWKGAMAEIPRGSSTRLEEASEANLSLAC